MKAKEYAQEIIDSNYSQDAVLKMVRGLVGETKDLVMSRKCQSESAINSVFKEIDQKYRAMCRILNKDQSFLREDGFKICMLDLYKDNKLILALDYFKVKEDLSEQQISST